MTDEYRELIGGARDALYALLRETEPGTGMNLHIAYRDLSRMLEPEPQRVATAVRPPAPPKVERPPNFPRALTMREREHAVLSAIGDDRLTIAEVTTRAQAALTGMTVYESSVRSIVMRLYRAGELQRESEPAKRRNHVRYRYFRKAGLEGPIADLDQTFHADESDD